LIAAGSGINNVFSHQKKNYNRGIEINPYINNLRVVYVEDPTMLQDGTSTRFENFNTANTKVKSDTVKINMDLMASALTEQWDPRYAWETIFQKPANKNWEDVLIAIKPNCAAGTTDGQTNPHASIAIINAVCEALIGLGARATNMTIYDTNGFSVNPATLYPAGSMVDGIKFLGPASRDYPLPLWSTISRAALEADIIINIASCKGHAELGGATLTLKNHLGTVGGHVTGPPAVRKIIDIHNSEEVLGNPIPGSVPPKQQLAIVDCLWTAQDGPLSAPDKAPAMITMGTSCPAVDCFTAIKVRLEKLKYSGVRETFLSYLAQYGYDTVTDVEPLLKIPSPPPDSLGRAWLDAYDWNPGTSVKGNHNTMSKNTTVTFSIAGYAFKPLTQKITLKHEENIKSITIMDVKGKVIQNLAPNENVKRGITWDGRNRNGKTVSTGTYVIKISGTKADKAVRFTLRK
jgi:hypothetical protein